MRNQVDGITDILNDEIGSGFSKLKLARGFPSWLGENGFDGLADDEKDSVRTLFSAANKALG